VNRWTLITTPDAPVSAADAPDVPPAPMVLREWATEAAMRSFSGQFPIQNMLLPRADIGANVGYATLLAASLVGRHERVISSEPGSYRFPGCNASSPMSARRDLRSGRAERSFRATHAVLPAKRVPAKLERLDDALNAERARQVGRFGIGSSAPSVTASFAPCWASSTKPFRTAPPGVAERSSNRSWRVDFAEPQSTH
jgi:hypothetical protein